VSCRRCGAASNQSDSLIGKNANNDIRRGDESSADRKTEARIDTCSNQKDRPAENSDRDGDLPPPPEQQADDEHGRNHVLSVRSRLFAVKAPKWSDLRAHSHRPVHRSSASGPSRRGRVRVGKMAVIRRLVLMAVTTGLVASCGASSDADCQPVAAAYRELFRDGSVTQTPVDGEVLAMESAVPGAWYIVAKVDGSTAVWVSDRDPQGEVLGRIITANRAAHRLSSADFVDMPLSRSESAQAAGDPNRIAVAESCIGG